MTCQTKSKAPNQYLPSNIDSTETDRFRRNISMLSSRMGQILHARLRMECSSLNSHLFRKIIEPSPSCSCSGFDSSYHFFFTCPKFSRIRNSYLPHNLHTFHTDTYCIVEMTRQTPRMSSYFYKSKNSFYKLNAVRSLQSTYHGTKKRRRKNNNKKLVVHIYTVQFLWLFLVGLGRR